MTSIERLIGQRETGQDVRAANITAVQAISNALKSSFGPYGLDKMIVNELGDVTTTNDGSTILKNLEIQHPAAKILVEMSDLQDQEVGDGTTTVVILAAELLKGANKLLVSGIHPTGVITGYKVAVKEAIRYIKEHLCINSTDLGKKTLLNVAKTSLSSKFIGSQTADFFAEIVVEAVNACKEGNESGTTAKNPVNSINVLKSHGKSLKESCVLYGYGLDRITRASLGMPKRICNARIALLDFNLRQYRMQMGVQIEVTDPIELEGIRRKERDILKDKIRKILSSGANIILTSQGMDDIALKYFVESGVIAARRVNKTDLIRLSKCTGATICLTLANMEGQEEFKSSWLGSCKEVVEEKLGDWYTLVFKGCKLSKAVSIVLRGANESLIDEAERSIHDALCTVSKIIQHDKICAGGGAIEAALSVYLESFAKTLGSTEQLAVAEFAEALLVIPRTLSCNGALDSPSIISNLRRHHHKNQISETKKEERFYGLDISLGEVVNNLSAGVIEPSLIKIQALKFATEAAITILRIDDVIRTSGDEDERNQLEQ